MADSQELAHWLLDHAQELNLQATEMTWPQDIGLSSLKDFEIEITLQDQIFQGRGTGQTEEEAITKAGAEALERAFTFGAAIHSTGVALHTNEKMAIENAKNEFIERSSFFAHFYADKPFIKINSTVTDDLKKKYSAFFRKISDSKIEISFYQAATFGDVCTVLCVATGLYSMRSWGASVGISGSCSLASAAQRAFFESVRGVASVLAGNLNPLTLGDFSKISHPTALDHQRLSRDVEYWLSVKYLFPDTPEVSSNQTSRFNFPEITISRLPCPFEKLKSAPVHVFRVNAPRTIDFRHASISQNSDLKCFLELTTGWDFSSNQHSALPHFLG